ncbi:MAG: SGNH/GDSL hydrolase family protein [Sedimentisphaeraceae bacterium JB056]
MSEAKELKWIDVSNDKSVEVDGLAWFEQNEGKFIRLPLERKDEITKTAWWMSLCPSTARVRFKTDSTTLRVKVDHGMADPSRIAMWHMSSVAVSGIDLYIGEPGNRDFWRTTHPKEGNGEYEHVYFKGLNKEMREFTMYLPSYSELKSLKIGFDEDCQILEPTAYQIQKPITVYGTSITQSGCSSRGSNGYVALLERRLNADVVNLGFSGSGCGEPVMAELMTQIDASVYIVDSVANMETDLMDQRYEKFVRILREKRPEIPVILMTKIHFAFEIDPDARAGYDRQHKALFATYKKLKEEGDDNVYLFDTGQIIKPGGDHPTVDGIHMTDVGYQMVAKELVPFVKEIIEE